MLNSRVFCRQAKCIPSHRRQHIKTFHNFIPGYHVSNNIISAVANMKGSRRIGKHHQAIVFWLFGAWIHFKQILITPILLPFWFNLIKRIGFFHFISQNQHLSFYLTLTKSEVNATLKIRIWGCGAVGSTSQWHCEGHGFDSRQLHFSFHTYHASYHYHIQFCLKSQA